MSVRLTTCAACGVGTEEKCIDSNIIHSKYEVFFSIIWFRAIYVIPLIEDVRLLIFDRNTTYMGCSHITVYRFLIYAFRYIHIAVHLNF